jgi:hypothetical protein
MLHSYKYHVWESLNHFDVYLFLYAFLMFEWLAFVIFGIINFIALLRVHVCAVACKGLEILHNTFHWILLKYFMNKSYRSLLKLNIKLNEKIFKLHIWRPYVCDVNQFKMININPLLFVKDKLFYLHKICTQSLSKRINNKAP